MEAELPFHSSVSVFKALMLAAWKQQNFAYYQAFPTLTIRLDNRSVDCVEFVKKFNNAHSKPWLNLGKFKKGSISVPLLLYNNNQLCQFIS